MQRQTYVIKMHKRAFRIYQFNYYIGDSCNETQRHHFVDICEMDLKEIYHWCQFVFIGVT